MSENIRVIVADDHPLIRKGIALVLADTSDIQVVAEAQNGAEAIEKATHIKADILLLDVNMPGIKAIEVVQKLQQLVPALKVIIVSAHDDDKLVHAFVHAGVGGYLLKDDTEASLVNIIRTVHGGEMGFSQSIHEVLEAQAQVQRSKQEMLTAREWQVLQAVAQGSTNNEIALQFNLRAQTVRNYTSRIYEKLGITSRAEALVWVFENGLIPLE